MEPIAFGGANATLSAPADMPDCGALPIEHHVDGMLSCWRMTWRERLAALVFGRVWLNIAGRGHPPVWLRCERDVHRETA
jgi:hypothetical protein